MLSEAALVIAVIGLIPLMAVIAYVDTRDLKIPNWTVLAVLGVFLVTGSWGLPLDSFLWRLVYVVLAFVVGLGIYHLTHGAVGAGDLKLIAALVPFLHGQNLLPFLVVFVAVLIVGTIFLIILRRVLKGRATRWKAFEPVVFIPVGLFIGITVVAVMIGEAAIRFEWFA